MIAATQFFQADSAIAGLDRKTQWTICVQNFGQHTLQLIACNMTPLVAVVLCVTVLALVTFFIMKPGLLSRSNSTGSPNCQDAVREHGTACSNAVEILVNQTLEKGGPLQDAVPIVALGDPIRYVEPQLGDRATNEEKAAGSAYFPGLVRPRDHEQHQQERPAVSRRPNQTARPNNQTTSMYLTLVVAQLQYSNFTWVDRHLFQMVALTD